MDLYFSSREKLLAKWLAFTWVSIRTGSILFKITWKLVRSALARRCLGRRSSADAAAASNSSSNNPDNNNNNDNNTHEPLASEGEATTGTGAP